MFIPFSDIQEFQKDLSRPVRCRNWNLDREIIKDSSVVAVDDSNRSEIEVDIRERNLIVVHCYIENCEKIGISLTDATSLWDPILGDYRKIVYSDGIDIAPAIQIIPESKRTEFVLYFNPLPKECNRFWLIESIPVGMTFVVYDITRNHADEYWAEVKIFPI